MPKVPSKLVTSEKMQAGATPLLFTGGACNIQDVSGPVRNPGRDPLAAWLDQKGWSYFDPQIHPVTHGREYAWEKDGPQEKRARELARLRVYEITATTISAVAMLEIMDDARRGWQSIVWFNGGENFAPIGLGDYRQLSADKELERNIGKTAYSHLLAYVNAGRHIRLEVPKMLTDCPHISFVFNLKDLKKAISAIIGA